MLFAFIKDESSSLQKQQTESERKSSNPEASDDSAKDVQARSRSSSQSNSKKSSLSGATSVSGDASAEEDAILDEELALISSRHQFHQQLHHLNYSSSSMTTSSSSTPTPSGSGSRGPPLGGVGGGGLDQDDDEEAEKMDAFRIDDMPSPLGNPRSLPPGGVGPGGLIMHRPVPRSLNVHSPTIVHHHPRLQALSGQVSLPLSINTTTPVSTPGCPGSPAGGGPGGEEIPGSASSKMSRSISDSTLRRAALHLNLNQSVLPSFTSLQQFKVVSSFDIGFRLTITHGNHADRQILIEQRLFGTSV